MNFLKRLFKKENNNVTELYLSLLDYNIIPPSNDFYNTEDNLILSGEYNNKYKEILSNRCKSSMDLKLDNIDLNIYVNIISKLTIELHNISSILNQSEDRNNINLNIVINKLNYYKSILSEYKDKSFIKLKVLEDILKKRLLFHSKRSIIESEISNLKGKILICQNNILGIEKELNYYYSFSSNNIPKVDNEKEYLSNIYNRDYRFTKALKLNIEYKKDISLSDICSIEILLENYLYNNKELLSKIKDEYNTLLNSNIERNKKLRIINNLINKYMAIDKIYKEKDIIFLNKLLALKFNTIEEDYINNGEKLINQYSYKEEIEYFGNIISKKIDNIVRDKDKRILSRYQEYFKEYGFIVNDYERLIRIFKDTIITVATYVKTTDIRGYQIIINGNGSFNIKQIMDNSLCIGLILSMDSPEKLINYINNFKIRLCDCHKVYFYDDLFKWNKKVPLVTVSRLIYENYIDSNNEKFEYTEEIVKEIHNTFILHYLLMGEYSKGVRHKNELLPELIRDYYHNNKAFKNTLYEGVKEITKKKSYYRRGLSFIDYIKTKPSMPMLLYGINNINLPSTLQKLNISYFQVHYNAIKYYQINSNIEEIISISDYEKEETIIIFNNYKEINALYNRESFKKLFRGTLIINRANYAEAFTIDKLGFPEEEGIYDEKYDFTINLSDLIDKKNSYSEEEILDKLYDTFHNRSIKEKRDQETINKLYDTYYKSVKEKQEQKILIRKR